jgi:hypothetical protein
LEAKLEAADSILPIPCKEEHGMSDNGVEKILARK